jgi:hypothetical protein
MRVILASLLFLAVSSVGVQSARQTWCERNTALLYGHNNETNGDAQVQMLQSLLHVAFVGDSQSVQGLLTADSPVLDVFTGRIHYRYDPPDFTTNAGEAGILVEHLVAFFGSALGCGGDSFPQREVPLVSMRETHAGMQIVQSDFDYFNLQFTNTLFSFGVSAADISVVQAFLSSFAECGSDPICTGPQCNTVKTSTDAKCMQDYMAMPPPPACTISNVYTYVYDRTDRTFAIIFIVLLSLFGIAILYYTAKCVIFGLCKHRHYASAAR